MMDRVPTMFRKDRAATACLALLTCVGLLPIAGCVTAGPGFGLAAGTEEEEATDLTVQLYLAAGDWQPAVNRAASRIAGRLAGRLRRGVEFSVAPGPA